MATISFFRPAKDVFIADDAPASNLNGAGLRTGLAPGPKIRRTLLHFDLGAMPSYQSIDAATLELRITLDGILDVEAYVYRVTQTAWTESGASWTRYDGVSNWASAGGDYDVVTPVPLQWYEPSSAGVASILPMRDFVVDALNNRGRQLHLLLRQADEGFVAGEYRYADRELDDLASATYPRVVISYTRPATERTIDDPRSSIGAAGAGTAASGAAAVRPASAARPSRAG